ncbi:MAG: formylmethanofuran dehydrogenase [Geminicoccaceae bacterium]|nr:formylmethanofuran dehydrogenase [Geminicoccaceae bacterium]MDW8341691.1 formylmethanofuran dehydrogenase [Geminicoccaceae bacterium]MDW8444064.1 formylmethanofuran dehydrogenase [Acetobacteraceae bacterium]
MQASRARLEREVVCPFCALLCDDLEVAVEGERLAVRDKGCARAREAFARPLPEDRRPRLRGEPVPLEAAAGRAAELLGSAGLPLFAGLEADLAGLRAVVALAERTGGVVDPMTGEGARAQLRAVQRSGWVAGTLAEARNRPDLVLLVGDGWRAAAPRLFERVLAPAARLDERPRRLLQLGGAPPREPEIEHLPCPEAALAEQVALLRALLRDRPVAAPESLRALADAIRTASYRLLLWATESLPAPAVLVHHLAALSRELNARGRAVALPLASSPGPVTARQLLLWQTGVPDPVGFADGAPEQDPVRWAGERLLAEKAADLLVWIDVSGFRPPPVVSVPAVLLIRAGIDPPFVPEVLIPIATPGLDHPGDLYRTDTVVALRARGLRRTALPSAAEVLAAIAGALPDPAR